ncbi:MAG: DUF3021 domain-containing protein [Lachnospiraceae bacterium]|nr:DUF3021 domain-containing protein [Lachnospiraceae bacterium]
MKKYLMEFFRRGFMACGFGPLVLAIVYLILQKNSYVQILTINQVCTGIFSLSLLAFLAGGMNVLYQIERLPLLIAIFIHGCVLYIGYLTTYLLNNWLEFSLTPIFIFTFIFLFSYLAIWIIIYSLTKKNTKAINEKLPSISSSYKQ